MEMVVGMAGVERYRGQARHQAPAVRAATAPRPATALSHPATALRPAVTLIRPASALLRPTPALGPAPARPARLPARIYRRRQVVAAGLVIGAMLLLGAALGALGGGPLPASERSGPAASLDAGGPVYVVQPGDTLWSIATRLDPGADPRPLVDRLVAAHGSATLHVGEVIRLPAEAGP